MSKETLGILASGRGSNLRAILNHLKLGVLENVEARALVSDNPKARALEIADKHGVPHEAMQLEKGKENKREFEERVHEIFEERDVSLVILAGYMQIVSPYLIEKYRERIMNIHPSLLPSFKGLNAQKKALDYGAKVSGCTVHYAVEDVDVGPIILQQPVPIKEGDDEKILSDRILIFEHRLYSKAIQLHADDRLEVEDGRVKIDYSGDWEDKWRERQEKFIESQRRIWQEKEHFEEVWDDKQV